MSGLCLSNSDSHAAFRLSSRDLRCSIAACGGRLDADGPEGHFHCTAYGWISGGYLRAIARSLGRIHRIRSEPVCGCTCACGVQNPWIPWFQFRSCFMHCRVINIQPHCSSPLRSFLRPLNCWMHRERSIHFIALIRCHKSLDPTLKGSPSAH